MRLYIQLACTLLVVMGISTPIVYAQVPPTPVVTLTASPLLNNNTVTLTWSATNVTGAGGCGAQGDWGNGTPKPSSGSETITGITIQKTFTLICTGSLGGSYPPGSASVTVVPILSASSVNGDFKFQFADYSSGTGGPVAIPTISQPTVSPWGVALTSDNAADGTGFITTLCPYVYWCGVSSTLGTPPTQKLRFAPPVIPGYDLNIGGSIVDYCVVPYGTILPIDWGTAGATSCPISPTDNNTMGDRNIFRYTGNTTYVRINYVPYQGQLKVQSIIPASYNPYIVYGTAFSKDTDTLFISGNNAAWTVKATVPHTILMHVSDPVPNGFIAGMCEYNPYFSLNGEPITTDCTPTSYDILPTCNATFTVCSVGSIPVNHWKGTKVVFKAIVPPSKPAPTFSTITPGACGSGQITLNWTDMSASGATGYYLSSSHNNTTYHFTPSTVTSHPDTGLSTSGAGLYSYGISAIYPTGVSATTTQAAWSPALCPTLTAALMATPSSGVAPLTTTLTATAGGTATGQVNYQFKCNNALLLPTWSTSQTTPNYICSYSSSGTYIAAVLITRQSVSLSATTPVTVTAPPPVTITPCAPQPSRASACGVPPSYIYSDRNGGPALNLYNYNSCPTPTTATPVYYCAYQCNEGFTANGNRCSSSDQVPF